MTVTSHTMTIDLPVRYGEGDGADVQHVKVDMTFNYRPGDSRSAPELALLKAAIAEDRDIDESLITLRERVEDFLFDEGYDAACDLAEQQRGEMAA